MKVIFLDIDGVLNCQDTQDRLSKFIIGLDDEKIEVLQAIVEQSNAYLVLTSSWMNIEENLLYLERRLAEHKLFIFDQVDHLGGKRGTAIHKYLNEHQNIDAWCVIDDERFRDYDDEIERHFVKTDFYRNGLGWVHVQYALAILHGNKFYNPVG